MKPNTVLDIFMENPGEYLSGEEISRRLSISRAAVWKQINKLREAGYEFDAISRRGYRLVQKPSRLNAVTLMGTMRTDVLGRQLKVLDVTTSTQEDVRRLAEEGAQEGTLVIAEEQTVGRGRFGRKWFSPPGKGIWMSLLLRPGLPLSCAPQLTLLTAVAVCRAIRSVTGVDSGIKWPNDLLVHGRKICGILLESVAEDERIRYCIAGIGIDANMTAEDYPEELRDKVSSLRLESGQPIDRESLIGAVMSELEKLYKLYLEEGFGPIAHLWEALSVTINQEVTLNTPQGPVTGYATGIDMSGALILDQDGRKTLIFSGDVQLGG
ncbi:biotin--[acetyl-CoA-carboxylase] ligase [Paenibacillus sp. J22TS3]|uniref:biotin--[acetyl-CoA-carboxylase] ligase n=1 Tax=Paenibacillus sp. J22TS3 TaxID=2807192 RepID=UPI001B181B28|nr:biotin--[acetyl-CoA-carboxylase] ligase [Paenibacillus sp. J22TS3]GIP20070.1 bifunctional ligase/repressor BirA [Paenibacillus sp. J22TS3]